MQNILLQLNLQEKIQYILTRLGFKDLLIIFTTIILLICIIKIRKLKKLLIREIQKRLIPQLTLEIDKDATGVYIKNEGLFLARNIKIEDTEFEMDDAGYRLNRIMKFNNIDSLKPNERLRLDIKVFDKEGNFKPNVTDALTPHLLGISFKLRIFYANIENVKFCASFNKRREKFNIEEIHFIDDTNNIDSAVLKNLER